MVKHCDLDSHTAKDLLSQTQSRTQRELVLHFHLCDHKLNQIAIPVLLPISHNNELRPSQSKPKISWAVKQSRALLIINLTKEISQVKKHAHQPFGTWSLNAA